LAYGTVAGVTMLVGGVDTKTFTEANMAIAIALADVIVDSINSGASAGNKSSASDLIAAEYMKGGRVANKLKGLTSDGGTGGRPSRSGSYADAIPKAALILLSEKVDSEFNVSTPSESGEW